MRSASVIVSLLLGFFVALFFGPFVAPSGLLAKPENIDKGGKDKKTISSIDELEGRTLDQWASLLRDADPSLREKAITMIPRYGDAAKFLVPEMILRCKDKDLGPRVKAVMALGVMKLDEKDIHPVASTLAHVLDTDPQHAAKLQAALSLTRFGNEVGEGVMSALIGGTQDTGSWQIRKASIMALRRIGVDKKTGPAPKATTYMLMATRDPAHFVRVQAVMAIGYMGRPGNPALHEEVIKRLKFLTKDTDKIVAIWSQTSLMSLEGTNEAGIQQIAEHLNAATQLEVRGNAVMALGAIWALADNKAKANTSLLLPMLKDRDNGVIVVTGMALAAIGDKSPKVIAALNEAIEKATDDALRAALRGSLDELMNSKKPDTPTVKDAPKEKDVVKP